MVEYLPWSKKVYQESLNQYRKGFFSSLDIELGGDCNFRCLYCDSPKYSKKCQVSVPVIKDLLSTGNISWVYICGLGEPTFCDNYKKLIELLECCSQYGVRCSIFSNLSNLTSKLKEYIYDGILHVQFKYDTKNADLIKTLYGTSSPKYQLYNIRAIKRLVKSDGRTTNLAASIVPTRLNIHNILPIVEECLEANIFPLLGELEYSGRGQENYNRLCLHPEEVSQLKKDVDKLCREIYEIPVCPSVISGIHIDYSGHVTVDKTTGLSCHWFWLDKPQTNSLIHCGTETSLDTITKAILDYRNNCIENIVTFLNTKRHIGMAFGGCGGNTTDLFKQYLENHRRDCNDLPR